MAALRPVSKPLRSLAQPISCHRHRRTLSSSSPLPKLSWLDLRGTGLSAAERLAIEEVLLRHDPLQRCWGIVGIHEPTSNRYLNFPLPPYSTGVGGEGGARDWNAQRKLAQRREADVYGHENTDANRSCAIILGIGGKPEKLINLPAAQQDGVLVLKRFSGGGTVVVDHDSLWTTFIGRNKVMKEVKPFPREIMQWSADVIFAPAFEKWNEQIVSSDETFGAATRKLLVAPKKRGRQTLVFQGKSCGFSGGFGESLVLPPELSLNESNTELQNCPRPKFQLRENDYVLGERKMGGNAQSIVKDGWLHHTSFLWDYDAHNMQYLTLPDKRPDYRGDRPHDEFLVKLKDHYDGRSTKHEFFGHVKSSASESFELEEVTTGEVLGLMNEKFGGLQGWFDGKCRTKPVRV